MNSECECRLKSSNILVFSLGHDGASWVRVTMSSSRASLTFWRGGRKWWPSFGSCGCGLKRVSKWEQFELRALSCLSGGRSFVVVCFGLVVVQRSVFCIGVGRGGAHSKTSQLRS